MAEKKIADATAAEVVVRRALEAQYGDKIKSLSFWKSWYDCRGTQEFYDVEGTLVRKKGKFKTETRNFRYQVDPYTGSVIGYEETIPR